MCHNLVHNGQAARLASRAQGHENGEGSNKVLMINPILSEELSIMSALSLILSTNSDIRLSTHTHSKRYLISLTKFHGKSTSKYVGGQVDLGELTHTLVPCWMPESMIGEKRQLVTNERVEFEK